MVDVLSGEHVDFSRLVMQFPTAVDWQFGRTADGSYALRVDAPDVSFNTTGVFNKIPRSRVETLSSGASELIVTVPGNVHADAFELRAGRIVIDIKDGQPQANAAFEKILDATARNAPTPVMRTPLARPVDPEAGQETVVADMAPQTVTAPDPVTEEVMPSATTEDPGSDVLMSGAGQEHVGTVVREGLDPLDRVEFPIIMPGSMPNGGAETAPISVGNAALDEELVQRSEHVEELQKQLLEQIGRAVSQGLLDADITKTEQAVEETQAYQSEQEAGAAAAAQQAAVEEPLSAEDRSHIRIQSSIDREQKNRDEESRVDDRGTQCLSSGMIDVAAWGGALEDGLELPALRAATIGEFDLPNPDGVKQLARYYIYLTFGAEAKSVLKDFGVTVEGHDILWTLADIMDKGYAEKPGRLANQFRCDGAVAFWSVMAKEKLNDWEEYNMDSVLGTFSALPIHLRRFLGPKLSERFLAIGDEDSAKNIQSAIARVEGDHGDAFALLDAELKLADGDVPSGVGQLELIVGENGPKAPEALVKLIATQAAEGGPIDRRTAENAEAMSVEFRGSDYEATLRKAAIVARIYSGDVDMALRQVLSLRADEIGDAGDVSALLSQSLEVLAGDADDPTFSKLALGHLDEISHAAITDDARLKVAERLVDMGFFDAALSLMSRYSDQDDAAAKMTLARAFYGEGEMEAAIRYAGQVTSDDAKRLMSKAYFQLDDPKKAVEALDGLSADAQSDALSLVAEDWGRLERSTEPSLAGLADVVTKDTAAPQTDENGVPSLSSVEDLLSNSREMRDALEAVLN
ncbi:tetratricopeptide repeat protein [Celeribacter neptunius]|uniref:tetratricopeptide repeat protein n=1 Tax=Celeribacter neptunius TaxID=588602 RepID=UPI00116059B2|nr:hypothetical protein [Celeribacter neptunius]